MIITLCLNYGPFKKGLDNQYEVIREGYDWVAVKRSGSCYYIPKFLIGEPNEEPVHRNNP